MGWTLGLCGRVMVGVVLPFVWWLVSDRGVEPAGVVPGFDPPSDREAGLVPVSVVGPVDEFLFESAEERLGSGVDAPIVK